MTKKYNSPMLQVVSINQNDIIATSTTTLGIGASGSAINAEAPGLRNVFDEWYEGY